MYVIHPHYTGRDKGPVSVGCDCLAGPMGEPNPLPRHHKGCAIYSGEPLLFESFADAVQYARTTLGYDHGTFSIEPDEVLEADPIVTELMNEAGVSEDWYAQQPEPGSDCSSEVDHYGSLLTLGECPNCGQSEVIA